MRKQLVYKMYCPKCCKSTEHRKLPKSFAADLLMAVLTRFTMSLTSPDYECNTCGHQHN